jgi:transposase-like protein
MGDRKDAPKLSIERKAQIVAEKHLGLSTVKNIAMAHDIAENTVYKVVREASPEVIALAEEFKPKLIEKVKRNVINGVDVMYERMYEPSSKLSEITGAVKISHDILRLETDQSTINTGVTAPPIQQAIEFILECRRRGKTNAEIVAALDYFEQVDRSVREEAKLVLGEGLAVPEKIIENNEEKS